MTKYLLIVLVSVLTLTGCKKDSDSNPTTSAPTTGTISGKVTNAAGDSAIAGASITTSPATGLVQTDAQGKYTISNAEAGVYTITATKSGLNTGNAVATVTTGQVSTANIKMGVIANHAPAAPALIFPAAGASAQDCSLTLTWTCTDSDGDNITYDVYMDKNSSPTTKVATAQTAQNYTATKLDSGAIYYWKVIAKDSKGVLSNSSQVNSFVTKMLWQGLLVYYPFNADTKDLSGNNYNGTNHSAVSNMDRFGNTSGAYYFNGSSYISCPEQALSGLASFTITSWIKLTGTASGTILYKGTKSGECRLGLDNGKAIFVVGLINNVFYTVTGTSTILPNKYYQISARYTRGGQIEIWVNGVLESSLTVPSLNLKLTSETSSSVGAYNFNAIYSSFFYGNIDDIRIYNRLLSSAEIQSLYREGGWTGN